MSSLVVGSPVVSPVAVQSSVEFWAKAKAQFDFIASLGILPSELICVDVWAFERGVQVNVPCFLRLAERFGIESLEQVAYGDDQLLFIENGVEFRVVISAENRKRYGQEFDRFTIVRNEAC